MPVNRRSAIKQLFLISAGAALLPACVNSGKKQPAAKTYSRLPVTAAEETALADLSAAIIPTTDTPGAREVGAHDFALRMVNDCYKKEDREKFLNGLRRFQEQVEKQYGKSFAQCSDAEKAGILAAAGKDAGEEAAYFYNTFKRLTIQAYTSSEYYLTRVDVYKLVPGKFISSVKV